jgi:hypothetical protein
MKAGDLGLGPHNEYLYTDRYKVINSRPCTLNSVKNLSWKTEKLEPGWPLPKRVQDVIQAIACLE